MSLPVAFLSGADADLQSVFNRFEDYREGFGVEFMAAVDAHLTSIIVIAILDLRQDEERIRRRLGL